MTADTGQQAPAAGDGQAPAAGDAQGQGGTVDQRLAAQDAKINGIDSKVDGLGSKLDQLLGRLGGGQAPAAAPGPGGEDGGGSVAEQVRKGVDLIEARRKRETDAAAARQKDDDWRKSVEDRLAERRPSEPATGPRARIARWLVGPPDEK